MTKMRCFVAVVGTMTLVGSVATAGTVLYVDDDADPGGDGQSWNTPYKFLRDALADTEGVTEIRVGQGTYLPDRDEANPDGTGDREATFQLISGVSLVGGYLGTSAGPGEIPNARDIAQYETILSGDLLGDDGPDFENNDENSHHVLTATDAFNTLLDGFTVLGGNSDLGDLGGAGLRAEGSTLTVNQCTFRANSTDGDGGAILVFGFSDLTVTNSSFEQNRSVGGPGDGAGAIGGFDSPMLLVNCEITNNTALNVAGGIASAGFRGGIELTLINCSLTHNVAGFGGAVLFQEVLGTVINCTLTANEANNEEFGFGGAVFLNSQEEELLIANTLLWGNTALVQGGAISAVGGTFSIMNTTIGGNTAGESGGGINSTDDAVGEVRNSILWSNSDAGGSDESAQIEVDADLVSVDFSCIKGLTGDLGGIGNIGDDPLFVDPDNGNYRLSPGSPCIDAADNTAVPKEISADIDGNPRFHDDTGTPDTGNGTPPIVDMGAYEFQGTTISQCPWDLTGDGTVGVGDMLALFAAWGPCPGPPGCPGDFNNDGFIGVGDLLILFANWGPCPLPSLMPFPISVEPPPADQLSIGVAFDGTNFLVGIHGDNLYGKGGSSQITAQLVSQTGTLVGPLIEVERTGGVPSVAFDGTNYLLIWLDDLNDPDDELYGQFIGSSGALVGTPFLIAATVQETELLNLISIAFGETGFLVTYYRELNPKTMDSKLYGRIVGTDGSVGEEITISSGLADHVAPNVAWDGTNYLVIWTDDGNDAVVIGRFVSPTGSLGLEFTINASPDPSDNPATVAFDGTNYLVAWTDEVGGKGSGQCDVLGQLVSTAGTLVGGVILISTAPGQQFLPFIAFDGADYLVTWTDFRNDANGDFACDPDEGTCADIYGQYISSSGPLVGTEFAISTEPDTQLGSAVVFADGKYLVVYNTLADLETGLGVFGVFITP